MAEIFSLDRKAAPSEAELSEDQQAMLAMLDETARRVRGGKIAALAITYVWRDGDMSTRWRCGENGIGLLGAVSRLAYSINHESFEETAGPIDDSLG